MANTSVFTGADGSITLSTVAANGREAEVAQGIIDGNDLVTIGRATGVSLEVRAEVRPFHELGQRYATELRPGNVSVRGTIQRAYLNGALCREFPGPRHYFDSMHLGEGGIRRRLPSFAAHPSGTVMDGDRHFGSHHRTSPGARLRSAAGGDQQDQEEK